jgi:hypothetical protein
MVVMELGLPEVLAEVVLVSMVLVVVEVEAVAE